MINAKTNADGWIMVVHDDVKNTYNHYNLTTPRDTDTASYDREATKDEYELLTEFIDVPSFLQPHAQTYDQYLVKGDMGLLKGCKVSLRFHWKFWKPIDAIGGKVYMGIYAIF